MNKKNLLLAFFLCAPFIFKAQSNKLEILNNKEGIVVLRLSICDKSHDEYCLTDQDIYFRNHRHTVADFHLLKEMDSIIVKQFANTALYKIHETISELAGFHNITGSLYFAQDILSTGENWLRAKGGEMFILNNQDPYTTKEFFIVYKIKGKFAMVSDELDQQTGDIYNRFFGQMKYSEVHYPIAGVLDISSFSRISKKDRKRLGLKRFSIEYYRIRTQHNHDFFNQSGKGQREK